MTLANIDEAVAAGASQAAACELIGLDERTVQRWRARPDLDDLRRGPKPRPDNAMTAEEEAEIVALVTSPEFVGMSPHQLVAKLADMSIFIVSESTIYRLLRRRRLLRHRDRSRPRTRHRPREHVATGPNQVWAWDITYLPAGVRGTFWYLYAILDVWSRKVVGWAVHDVQSDDLAAAARRRGVPSRGRRSRSPGPARRQRRCDEGQDDAGQARAARRAAVVQPAARQRRQPVPRGAVPHAEVPAELSRRPFLLLEDARRWVAGFVGWYNDDHQHSGIRFVTPSQRHDGHDVAILAHRPDVYLAARARQPEPLEPSHAQLDADLRPCASTRNTESTSYHTHAATTLTLTGPASAQRGDHGLQQPAVEAGAHLDLGAAHTDDPWHLAFAGRHQPDEGRAPLSALDRALARRGRPPRPSLSNPVVGGRHADPSRAAAAGTRSPLVTALISSSRSARV